MDILDFPTEPEWTVHRAAAYAAGRVHGLAGTVRYELPDELRAELRHIAEILEKALGLRIER